LPLSDLIDVVVVGSLRGIEMNKIPGLTNPRCPSCGGNITRGEDGEPECLQCGDKNRSIIRCSYCGIEFRHNGKEDYQNCPRCHTKLICLGD